jgi:hypothetical protein
LKTGICKVWDRNGRMIAEGTYKDGLPFDGTFVVEKWPDEDGDYRDLLEYVEQFLTRPIRVVAYRHGKEIKAPMRNHTRKGKPAQQRHK